MESLFFLFGIFSFFLGGVCYRIRGGASLLKFSSTFLARVFWACSSALFCVVLLLIRNSLIKPVTVEEFSICIIVPICLFLGLMLPHAWGQMMGYRFLIRKDWLDQKRKEMVDLFGEALIRATDYNEETPKWKRYFKDFSFVSIVGVVRSLALLPLVLLGSDWLFLLPLVGILHGLSYLSYRFLPEKLNFIGIDEEAVIHGGTSWSEFFWGGVQFLTIFTVVLGPIILN